MSSLWFFLLAPATWYIRLAACQRDAELNSLSVPEWESVNHISVHTVDYPQNRIQKRLLNTYSGLGTKKVTSETVYTDWVDNNWGLLQLYYQYSTEVRKKINALNDMPYITKLSLYAADYTMERWRQGDESIPQILPYNRFIDKDVLNNLLLPWRYRWEMPEDGLSPRQRIQGMSKTALDSYPQAIPEDEEQQVGPVLVEDISTEIYLQEFSTRFATFEELARWLLNPRTLSAENAPAGQPGLYLDLYRRIGIHNSLLLIRQRLDKHILPEITKDQDFDGELPIPDSLFTQVVSDIDGAVAQWERVIDLLGVMATTMKKLIQAN
ncbi:hypothetical protein ABW19_dt0201649 [Dactylella cylindrospora]|nr:hypothetical protein ABW19_dt0201649 [Dactylella cylindrospora]